MKTKHTPGPWALDDDGFVYGEGFIVSDPHSSPDIDLDEREANARLIAAAPELLQLLTDARRFMLDDDIESCRGVLVGDVCSRVLERVGDD